MGAFLGYPDGKYHIPGWGLGQVTTFLFFPWKAVDGVYFPGKQGFFLYRKMEYNP
jgi:hypothetical protein